MEREKIIGLGLCGVLFSVGFVIHGNVGLYFNLVGLFVVIGGTFGAALVSFSTERLRNVYRVLKTSCSAPSREPAEIVETLVDLSLKSKIRGVLSLQEDEEEAPISFLRRALGLLVDGYPKGEIQEVLSTEMYYFRLRRAESERVLRTLADLCPSFGLVGSVVGLIGMMTRLGEISSILTTIPIALTSTLYGVIFANVLFHPLATKVRERTHQELLLQKLVMEGILGIAQEVNPRILETKLKSYLTPSARRGRLVSLRRIQEKIKTGDEAPVSSETQSPAPRYLEA